MTRKKTAILFDCDGTIVDSIEQALESFHYAIFMVTNKKMEKAYIKKFFGPSGDIILRKLIDNPVQAEKAFEIYLQHQREMAKSTKLFPGIKEILDRLAQWEIPMGIVTGRHELDLDILIKPHGIEHYFSAKITDNMLDESKPHPEGIRKALQQLGGDFETVYYVGDSPSDLRAAHAADCKAIAALWDGKSDCLKEPSSCKKENPEFLFNLPEDILRLFE